MSDESLKLAKATTRALIAVLTAFAAFWGVGSIITKIDDLRVQQAVLDLEVRVIQNKLDEMKSMQSKYWNELQLQQWRNQHFMDGINRK